MSLALRAYHSFLTEVEELTTFVSTATEFKRRVWTWIDQTRLTRDDRAEIESFTRLQIDAKDRISSSAFFAAQAGFEQFFSDRVSEYLDTLQLSHKELSEKFPNLINWNLKVSGQALARIHDAPDHLKVDYEKLVSDLGTCVSSSKKVVLQSKLLATASSNLDVDEIEKVLQRIPRSLKWNDMADDKSIQEVLGTRGQRETEKAIRDRLITQVRWRNTLAHSQGLTLRIGWAEYEKSVGFLREMSRLLDKHLPG